jgi:hypothetical protein
MSEPLFKENSYFVSTLVISGVRETSKPCILNKRDDITAKILKDMNESPVRDKMKHSACSEVFLDRDKIPFGFSCNCGDCHLIINELPLWSISIPREKMLGIKNQKLGFEVIDGKVTFFKI